MVGAKYVISEASVAPIVVLITSVGIGHHSGGKQVFSVLNLFAAVGVFVKFGSQIVLFFRVFKLRNFKSSFVHHSV